jgi:hypothetical protein
MFHRIDDAIRVMDEIIDWSRAGAHRIGFFTCLYRATTLEVRRGIGSGRFQNAARMEVFDVHFARYFFDALHVWKAGGRPAAAWSRAFRACEDEELFVLQHLLLGMNAHINLDLAATVADLAGIESREELRVDYDEINHILAEMVDGVQDVLNDFNPGLKALDFVGLHFDEAVASFSIRKARDRSWAAAMELVDLPEDDRPEGVRRLDDRAARLAEAITLADDLAGPLGAVRRLEPDYRSKAGIVEVIDRLAKLG